MGIVDYFGNPGATGELPGGRFSTSPRGVAVNDGTGDVYIVDSGNNRIQRLDEDGDFVSAWGRDVIDGVANPGAAGDTNDRQTVTVGGGATGGSFTLSFGANTTAPISYPATAGDVDAALELIASIGAGNVNVTGPSGGPYAVEFIATKASVDQAEMTANPASLTPSGTVAVTTNQDGASYEICTVAAQCKAGTTSNGSGGATALGNGGTLNSPGGIAINQSTGDLYVTNQAMRRVEQFDEDGNFLRAWGAGVVSAGSEQADEEQVLVVNATTGNYRLGPPTGIGAVTTTNGSSSITLTSTSFGSFGVGDEVKIAGVTIAAGTTVAACAPSCAAPTTLTLSNPITAGAGTGQAITAAQSTATLAHNASAPSVEGALNALGAINAGGGSVSVSAGPTYPGGALSYLIEFDGGPLADTNRQVLASYRHPATPLSGGKETVSVIPRNKGAVGFEICENQARCKNGTSAPEPPANTANTGWHGSVSLTSTMGYPAVAPAGAPNAGNVIVGDAASVKEFDADGDFVRSFGYDRTIVGPDNAGTTNEVRTVTVKATSGEFRLRIGGAAANNSVALPWNATAAQVEAALNQTIVVGGYGAWVSVTGGPGDATGSSPYAITFEGTLGGKDIISNLQAESIGLAGPGGAPAIATPTEGVAGFEICKAVNLEICLSEEPVAGAGLGQFGSGSPTRLAADTDGDIYALEGTANFRVQKFTPSGPGLVNVTASPYVDATLKGTGATNTPTDLAVDTNGDVNPANDRIFVVKAFPAGTGVPPATVAERRVLEFDSTGALSETHLANSGLNSVNGFALKAGGEPGYLTSTTPKIGVYEINEPTPPTVALEPTTDIGASCAELHGTINPNGGASLTTTYRFEYSSDGGSSWTIIPIPAADIGSGEAPVAVEQEACQLEPNKNYQVRLLAIKGGLPTPAPGSAGDFKTLAAPPTAQTFMAYWDASAEELVLRGAVNPNNSPTTYYFEYGTEPCSSSSCSSVPVTQDASAGSGGQAVDVLQRLEGLEPGTTYHFLLVADGFGAPVRGSELEARTPALSPQCSNEQLRRENDSTGLPDCRAFEWVSNGDSWANGVSQFTAVVPDGNRAQFRAAAFNDPDSAPAGKSPYTAVREEGRWSVYAALPPGARAAAGGLFPIIKTSPDLTRVLWPGNSFGQEFRGEAHWLIENIDGSSTAAGPPLVPLTRTGPTPEGGYVWDAQAATPDFSSFIFQPLRGASTGLTGETFLPGEPLLKGQNANLYMIEGAGSPSPQLELVNRQDNPSPGVPGAQLGGECGAKGHAISANGDVVYFSAIPGGVEASGLCGSPSSARRLFRRTDSEDTFQVSTPTCSRVAALPAVPACGTTAPAGTPVPDGADTYQGASEDGSIVFFTSSRQLTDSDTDATEDLYLYDEDPPAGQPNLVQVSAGEAVPGDHPTVGFGAEAIAVVGTLVDGTKSGVSGDGSRTYFIAKGRLVSEASKGAFNVYAYERDEDDAVGRIAHVASLDSFSGQDGGFVPTPDEEGGDGQFLVFITATAILEEDTDASIDAYRYDDEAEELLCLSCMGSGPFDVNFQTAAPASDDGSLVTFATKEGLLEDDDLNGASDVYLWREGSLDLISQGSGQQGAALPLISGDGRSVFFMAGAPFYPADTNNARDVYVARIGGGFPVPPMVPVCAGEGECRSTPAAPPTPSSPATPSFVIPGNPPLKPKPCKKGQVRKQGKCVKKKKGKARRKQAGRNRGGNR